MSEQNISNQSSNKSGIIFDLDGTLWDSIDNILISWNIGIREAGYDFQITLEELTPLIGKPMDEIATHLFVQLPLEDRLTLMSQCSQVELDYLAKHGGNLFNKLTDVLGSLGKDYPLFIVSNCQIGYIEAFLGAHDLSQYFKDWECWENTMLTKGENIRLVMERNKLEKAVYIGDTEGDRIAAKAADIPFIFADYGFGQVTEYEYSINELSELPQLVSELLA